MLVLGLENEQVARLTLKDCGGGSHCVISASASTGDACRKVCGVCFCIYVSGINKTHTYSLF